MSMKICASNTTSFDKIKNALNRLDKDFMNKFETAEFVMDGYINDVMLVSRDAFVKTITLPKGFSIETIENSIYSEYEKNTEGSINEKVKYQVEILGIFENQKYKFIYTNLLKITTTICFK